MYSSRACSTFEPKTFALGNWADPEKNFYIPTAAYVEELHTETETQNLVFVRGPPASGKSTLAHAIHTRYDYLKRRDRTQRSYIFLACQSLLFKLKDDAAMEKIIMKEFNAEHNLSGHFPKFDRLYDGMAWLIRENIAVIADEGHLLFREEYPSIYSAFLKHDKKPTCLFFSTTSESVKDGYIRYSPAELSKKFFFYGSFDVDEQIESELEQTGVKLSNTAIRALVQISGRHRGVFVRLCAWIKKVQRNHEPNKVCVVFLLMGRVGRFI